MRSFRPETPAPPAAPPAEVPPAPAVPAAPPPASKEPEPKGFSLPPARKVEAEKPAPEKPPREKPSPAEKPRVGTPFQKPFQELKPPPEDSSPRVFAAPSPEGPKIVDLDAPPPPPSIEEDLPPLPPLRKLAEPERAAPRREEPRRPEPEEKPRPSPPPPRKPEPAAPRHTVKASSTASPLNPTVILALAAGAVLGTVSLLAFYLLVRPDTATTSAPSGASPFDRSMRVTPSVSLPPAPAPTPAPAAPAAPAQQSPPPLLEAPDAPPPAPAPVPVEKPRPAPAPVPKPLPKPAARPAPRPAPAPAPQPRPAPAKRPQGPSWTFQGEAFDLLTARGVFAARLVFSDADGNVVGETETGPAGRYKIEIPAGSGYSLRIEHSDYADRYIDEGDSTSSLREATPEERKTLMSSSARNLPWVGDPKKAVRRDLALVPRAPEEP
jgi:hypothetical protein